MTTRLACILGFASLFACGSETNPNYCPGANPDNNCAEIDAAVDGIPGCTSSAQCSSPRSVCDTSQMTCVQCTAADAAACTGTTPVCGSDEACHACSAHTQCTSDVCLPDGSCSDGTNVAYVDPTGTDNTSCTKTMPCTKVAKALGTSRPFIKFTGTTNEQVSINNQNVTVLADPGAQLTSTSNGIVLEVKGTSQVSIYDLEITGASGSSGYGISMPTGNTAVLTVQRAKITSNAAGGITASGGTLTVTQSTVSLNTGGGISLAGTSFTLENNFIVKNGSVSTAFGGVLISQLGSGSHVLDFNTITQNGGTTGTTTGVVCSLVTQAVTFPNNIIYGNQGSGAGTQLSGNNCSATYSDIGPDTVTGTGNINADPMFVDPGHNDFHLMTASMCKDAADPAATLSVDIDGDSRPQGSGRDMGADEFKP